MPFGLTEVKADWARSAMIAVDRPVSRLPDLPLLVQRAMRASAAALIGAKLRCAESYRTGAVCSPSASGRSDRHQSGTRGHAPHLTCVKCGASTTP